MDERHLGVCPADPATLTEVRVLQGLRPWLATFKKTVPFILLVFVLMGQA